MKRYAELVVAALEPGDEISALEGVDLAGEKAVVVELTPGKGDTTVVTLLFRDLKVSRKYEVKNTSLSSVDVNPPRKQVPEDVVDSLRATSPDRAVPPIRDGVPDTFFPPDVNGTQPTMTDVLWRPTVRRTPFTRGLQAAARRRAKTTGYDFSTFPALDFPPQRDNDVPRSSTEISDSYEDGSQLRPRHYNKPYETRWLRSQNPHAAPARGFGTWTKAQEKHLAELADLFWASYKEVQLTKLPSRPGLGHSGMHLDVWATIWLQETGIAVKEMDELWQYMIATRMATATAYRAWKDTLRKNMTHPLRTPPYEESKRKLAPEETSESARVAATNSPSFYISQAADVVVKTLEQEVLTKVSLEEVLASLAGLKSGKTGTGKLSAALKTMLEQVADQQLGRMTEKDPAYGAGTFKTDFFLKLIKEVTRWLERGEAKAPIKQRQQKQASRRTAATATVEGFIAVLISKLTQHDKREYEREIKRGMRGNIYRLGILLKAAHAVEAEFADRLSSDNPADLEELKLSIQDHFNDSPYRRAVLKQIDQYLTTGKAPSLVRASARRHHLANSERYAGEATLMRVNPVRWGYDAKIVENVVMSVLDADTKIVNSRFVEDRHLLELTISGAVPADLDDLVKAKLHSSRIVTSMPTQRHAAPRRRGR